MINFVNNKIYYFAVFIISTDKPAFVCNKWGLRAIMLWSFNVAILEHILFQSWIHSPFLGAFAKLRRVTISFVISVCQSVRFSGRLSVRPHVTIRTQLYGFSWNLIFEYFSKIYWENSSWLKSDNNKGYFTWRPICIFDHISLISS